MYTYDFIRKLTSEGNINIFSPKDIKSLTEFSSQTPFWEIFEPLTSTDIEPYVRPSSMTINNECRQILFQHPPSKKIE